MTLSIVRTTIRSKLWGLILLFLLAIFISAEFYFFPETGNYYDDENRTTIKNEVGLIYAFLEKQAADVFAGKTDRETALKKVFDFAADMSRAENTYFWIQSVRQPYFINGFLQGTRFRDRIDPTDEERNKFLIKRRDVYIENGEGFIDALPTPVDLNSSLPQPSYAKLFKAWGFVICGRIYTNKDSGNWAVLHNWVFVGFAISLLFIIIFDFFVPAGPVNSKRKNIKVFPNPSLQFFDTWILFHSKHGIENPRIKLSQFAKSIRN